MIRREPLHDPHSAYRPIVYRTYARAPFVPGTTRPQEVINAVVSIRDVLLGIEIIEYRVQPNAFDEFLNILRGYHYFDIDVQQPVQDYMQPNSSETTQSASNSQGQPYFNLDFKLFTHIEVTIRYEFLNERTGLLNDLGIVDQGSRLTVVSATRQNEEPMTLNPFIQVLGNGAVPFLTNSPAVQEIQSFESATLSFIGQNYASERIALGVTSFDKQNNTIETGFVELDTPRFDYYQYTVGVGPSELRNITWTRGSVDIDHPQIGAYQVRLFFLPNSSPVSEIKRYVLESVSEDSAFRVHFLNALGGFDQYTFKNSKTTSLKIKSQTAQKQLRWGLDSPQHNPADTGNYVLEKQASTSVEVESKSLEPSVSMWLQELLYSPEVYVESYRTRLVISPEEEPEQDEEPNPPSPE